jgi:hypothetical protein
MNLRQFLVTTFLVLTFVAIAQHPLDIATASAQKAYEETWKQATVDEVREWLQTGVDVNTRGNLGTTALMVAAESSQDAEVIIVLLQNGADPHATTTFGVTVLMFAAKNQNAEIAALLLEAGADVNAKSEGEFTALSEAALSNPNPEVIELFLQAGAEVNAIDILGETALMKAAGFNETPDVVTLLLEAGADATLQNNEGIRAIDFADSSDIDPDGNLALQGTDAYARLEEASYPQDQDGRNTLVGTWRTPRDTSTLFTVTEANGGFVVSIQSTAFAELDGYSTTATVIDKLLEFELPNAVTITCTQNSNNNQLTCLRGDSGIEETLRRQ